MLRAGGVIATVILPSVAAAQTAAFPEAPPASTPGNAPPTSAAPVNSAPNAAPGAAPTTNPPTTNPPPATAVPMNTAPGAAPAPTTQPQVPPQPGTPPAATPAPAGAPPPTSVPSTTAAPVAAPTLATAGGQSAPAAEATHAGSEVTATSEHAEVSLPSRESRPLAIWGSMGWNSLAGFAFGASYSFTAHFSADAALGLSAIGPKIGTRFRYNVLKSNWTPSFGVGFQYGSGSGGRTIVQGQSTSIDPNDEDADAEVTIEPSAFVQALAAMTYQGGGGFNALFGVGYSVLLDEDNVQLHTGGERTADIVRLVTGSGIVLEVGLGYAF
jgi:hypothetical protein